MEWLLILSAMLSAVTGAFSGVRGGAESLHHQTEAATALRVAVPASEQAVERMAIAIPEDAPPLADAPALSDFAPPASVPLYADRLIE